METRVYEKRIEFFKGNPFFGQSLTTVLNFREILKKWGVSERFHS